MFCASARVLVCARVCARACFVFRRAKSRFRGAASHRAEVVGAVSVGAEDAGAAWAQEGLEPLLLLKKEQEVTSAAVTTVRRLPSGGAR